MSFAVLVAHHLSAPVVSIGFALLLVATLVTVEERELRGRRGDAASPTEA